MVQPEMIQILIWTAEFFSRFSPNIWCIFLKRVFVFDATLLVTSTRNLGLWVRSFVYLFIFMFFCVHGNSKSNEWIFLKFYVNSAWPKEEAVTFLEKTPDHILLDKGKSGFLLNVPWWRSALYEFFLVGVCSQIN